MGVVQLGSDASVSPIALCVRHDDASRHLSVELCFVVAPAGARKVPDLEAAIKVHLHAPLSQSTP
jgi:hypothetical protein